MRCYLLILSSGSSLDQHSNNVTLFNLVEQLNFPAHAHPPPGAILPLEVHAYFQLLPHELQQPFEVRFVLAETSGLETATEAVQHKSATSRYRTRTLGLPAPPAAGSYELRVDVRSSGASAWSREAAVWPLLVVQANPRPVLPN